MHKKTLYLHVGMDKTGTSAIQYFIFKNRKKLLHEIELFYPETGIWNDFSHHPFAFSIFEIRGFSMKDIAQFFGKLIAEIGDATNILLSSECLFKAPTKNGFKTFLDLIYKYFHQVKVIVYVRRQDKWVESRHKHSVISGNEFSLEMLMRPHFCNYKQFIDLWANIFGFNNIIVKAYETQQFVEGNIYLDFMSIFGLTPSDGYEKPDPLINASLGFDELEFKKLCNKIGFVGRHVGALNKILIEHTRTIPARYKSKHLLPPSTRLNLVNRYYDVNRQIAYDYLHRDEGELFYDSLPDPEAVWDQAPLVVDEKIASIGRFISIGNPKLLIKLKNHARKAIQSSEKSIADAGIRLSNLL